MIGILLVSLEARVDSLTDAIVKLLDRELKMPVDARKVNKQLKRTPFEYILEINIPLKKEISQEKLIRLQKVLIEHEKIFAEYREFGAFKFVVLSGLFGSVLLKDGTVKMNSPKQLYMKAKIPKELEDVKIAKELLAHLERLFSGKHVGFGYESSVFSMDYSRKVGKFRINVPFISRKDMVMDSVSRKLLRFFSVKSKFRQGNRFANVVLDNLELSSLSLELKTEGREPFINLYYLGKLILSGERKQE